MAVPHAEAATSARPSLSLVAQTEWSVPPTPGAAAPFDLTLRASHPPAEASVSVAIYSRLTTRSAFEAAVKYGPNGHVLDRITPLPLSSIPADPHAPGAVDLALTVTGGTRTTGPALALGCSPVTGTCTGVYPVVVSLAGRSTESRFTTFLTYAAGKSAHALRVALVLPLAGPGRVDGAARSPGQALAPMPRSQAAAFETLASQLRASPAVPVTLEPSPQTMDQLAQGGPAGRAAVTAVAAMSTDQAVDEVPPQPFVPVDLGALAGAGEPTEIVAQMGAGAASLKKLGVATATSLPWVAHGAVGSDLATGLSIVHASQVVVPDRALAPTTTGFGGTWASTFDLSLKATGHGTLLAAASTTVLAGEFTADRSDPALAASQFLADLAMVHFEQPNLEKVRGLVAVPPAGWTPNAAFDRVLLAGLEQDPVVTPVTLAGYFQTVAPGENRHLDSSGPGPVMSGTLAHALTTARKRVSAFASAIVGAPPVLAQLDDLLLSAENDTIGTHAEAGAVRTFQHVLTDQLRLVQFATERTVTLTARTGWIPITLVSGAPYTVHGTLSVSSDKFTFPHSATKMLKLDHTTNAVRIDVYARTSGELPIAAVFTSPKGGLVIAEGHLSVRSTATSVVGIGLSAVALVVLLSWWARTWWSGRRRRREPTGEVAGP